jgi:hypothetical protein
MSLSSDLASRGWTVVSDTAGAAFGARHDASGAIQSAGTSTELLRKVDAWNSTQVTQNKKWAAVVRPFV